ncbi:ceramide kinase-like [Ostrea edulis]|uniref:ceramide kinase-like n=1 Tax=Ostrea edulis TaxID=37623 RepID=UPI0024AF9A65|nr:ceramide kinase-like [Ostrea edulis]
MMLYNLVVDGLETKVTLDEENLRFEANGTESTKSTSYPFDDIIGCEEIVTGWFWKTEITRVWVIEHGSSNLLLKKCRDVSGDKRKRFQHDLSDKIANETKRPKRVLVLINPIGGNGTAMVDFRNIVKPVFSLSGISMDIIVSEHHGHLSDVANTYDFTNTDGVVLFGGDGTCYQVVNVLMRKRQEEQGVDINDQNSSLSPLNIPISLIPTGSRNQWAASFTGNQDVLTAALHVVKGRTVSSHLLAIYSDDRLLSFACASITYGFLRDIVYYSDRFRWMGRMRYRFVSLWLLLIKSHTQHVYDATVTFYTPVTEQHNTENNETEIFVGGKKLSGYSSYTSDTVVFNRKVWELFILSGNLIFDSCVVQDFSRMFAPKLTTFSSIIIYATIPVGSVRRFFNNIQLMTPLDIRSNEMEVVNARGLSVEIPERFEDMQPSMKALMSVMLPDGEKCELKHPSFQIWYKYDVVQIFSSYL